MLIMPKFVEKNRLNMPSTRIRQEQEIVAPVSYTHLTLPTIA